MFGLIVAIHAPFFAWWRSGGGTPAAISFFLAALTSLAILVGVVLMCAYRIAYEADAQAIQITKDRRAARSYLEKRA